MAKYEATSPHHEAETDNKKATPTGRHIKGMKKPLTFTARGFYHRFSHHKTNLYILNGRNNTANGNPNISQNEKRINLRIGNTPLIENIAVFSYPRNSLFFGVERSAIYNGLAVIHL